MMDVEMAAGPGKAGLENLDSNRLEELLKGASDLVNRQTVGYAL